MDLNKVSTDVNDSKSEKNQAKTDSAHGSIWNLWNFPRKVLDFFLFHFPFLNSLSLSCHQRRPTSSHHALLDLLEIAMTILAG